MYNGAYHNNIGVLGRYIEEPKLWGELFCPQHAWKYAENILYLILFWPIHAIDFTIPMIEKPIKTKVIHKGWRKRMNSWLFRIDNT